MSILSTFLLQIKCTGFNNGITLHIKPSTFCLQQNWLTELTPKTHSTLRPGSPITWLPDNSPNWQFLCKSDVAAHINFHSYTAFCGARYFIHAYIVKQLQDSVLNEVFCSTESNLLINSNSSGVCAKLDTKPVGVFIIISENDCGESYQLLLSFKWWNRKTIYQQRLILIFAMLFIVFANMFVKMCEKDSRADTQ